MLKPVKLLLFISLCISLSACQTISTRQVNPAPAAYAMPDAYSAAAVRDILAQGGNAVDASITAAFVLAVTFPEAGNIGGGGFLLTRFEDQNYFLDYRERAPLAASRDMYLDQNGKPIEQASLIGIRAAGVPGTVAGLWEAHKKFASLPWASLIQPAIELAEQGFTVHPKTAAGIPDILDWFGDSVNFADHFAAMQDGQTFKQPDLAATLKRIATLGPNDFYSGKTAQYIVAQSERDGGLLSLRDLAEYKAVWRDPLIANWNGYQVVTAPPPSSGGFAVIQLLKMKEYLDPLFHDVELNSAQYIHLVAEMEKRVFADRAEYFGDPDFVDIPIAALISEPYIERRAKEVQPNNISQLAAVKPGFEPPSTTHFSIVDKWGNAVSNTYTINWNYGSGVVVEGAGFLLNNEMDDFSTKPGVANVYGVIGGTANEIQPGKRMLSSMTPTILLKDNEVRLVVGTPGGSTIFTTVFQAIVNVVDFDLSPARSVGLTRFHHQLLPADLITTSRPNALPQSTVEELRQKGYRVQPHAWLYGDLQLIEVNQVESNAASDPRGIGVSGTLD